MSVDLAQIVREKWSDYLFIINKKKYDFLFLVSCYGSLVRPLAFGLLPEKLSFSLKSFLLDFKLFIMKNRVFEVWTLSMLGIG